MDTYAVRHGSEVYHVNSDGLVSRPKRSQDGRQDRANKVIDKLKGVIYYVSVVEAVTNRMEIEDELPKLQI